MKWVVIVLQAVLAAGFLMAGLSKVFSTVAQIEELFTEPMGYGAAFMYAIGAIETLAALGLIAGYRWRPLALGSSALLAVIMIGAVVSSLSAGMAGEVAMPVVYLVLLLVLIYFYWKKPLASRAGGINRSVQG